MNQKMENDEKQKCNINEASTSVPVDYQSDSHIESEEENVKGQKNSKFHGKWINRSFAPEIRFS